MAEIIEGDIEKRGGSHDVGDVEMLPSTLPAHQLVDQDQRAALMTRPKRLQSHRSRTIKGVTVPAKYDPHIQKRRAIAMPLWNRGSGAGEVREVVNAYLTSEGFSPVSIEVIRKDRDAIFADWELDYDRSSAENRNRHVAALNYIKTEAVKSYEQLRDQPKSTSAAAAFLKIAMDTEAQLALLDGTKKRAEVRALAEGTQEGAPSITRVYVGVANLDLV